MLLPLFGEKTKMSNCKLTCRFFSLYTHVQRRTHTHTFHRNDDILDVKPFQLGNLISRCIFKHFQIWYSVGFALTWKLCSVTQRRVCICVCVCVCVSVCVCVAFIYISSQLDYQCQLGHWKSVAMSKHIFCTDYLPVWFGQVC